MKIQITYEFKTASGLPTYHAAIAHSKEEADALCRKIEEIGYKVVDVTRDVYED